MTRSEWADRPADHQGTRWTADRLLSAVVIGVAVTASLPAFSQTRARAAEDAAAEPAIEVDLGAIDAGSADAPAAPAGGITLKPPPQTWRTASVLFWPPLPTERPTPPPLPVAAAPAAPPAAPTQAAENATGQPAEQALATAEQPAASAPAAEQAAAEPPATPAVVEQPARQPAASEPAAAQPTAPAEAPPAAQAPPAAAEQPPAASAPAEQTEVASAAPQRESVDLGGDLGLELSLTPPELNPVQGGAQAPKPGELPLPPATDQQATAAAPAAEAPPAQPEVEVDTSVVRGSSAPRQTVPEMAQTGDEAAGNGEQVASLPGETTATLPGGEGFRIVFEGASEDLTDAGGRLLSGLAEQMAKDDTMRLQVRAYAGGTPETASQARRLSLNRALAVRSFLIDRGVRGTRIDVRALGNTAADDPKDRVDLLPTR